MSLLKESFEIILIISFHLAFSNSVPSDVGFNSGHSPNDYSDLIASDYSCTSSVTSSRSGMGKVLKI